jgi:hypothetical protein
MPRDPREEPQRGDRLCLHGAVFQILEVGRGRVRLTAERDELSALSAGHWYALARFRNRFHDAEPAGDGLAGPRFMAPSWLDSSRDPIMQSFYLETEGCE